jgi:quercetin dioxygenase-like cupin family protein
VAHSAFQVDRAVLHVGYVAAAKQPQTAKIQEREMITSSSVRGSARRSLVAISVLGGAFLAGAFPAAAGDCPANQVVADGRGQKMGATEPKAVTDNVLTRINLVNEPVMLKDHALRLRRLVVKPGGVVPWHTHTDRPAIIYIISGKIVEYRSTCKTPILHKAGESTSEVKGTSHWWKNTGKQTVVLLSADLFHDKDDPHTM